MSIKKIFLLVLVFSGFLFSSCVVISDDEVDGYLVIKNSTGYPKQYLITQVFVSKDDTNYGERVFYGAIDECESIRIPLEKGKYYVKVVYEDRDYVHKTPWSGAYFIENFNFVHLYLDGKGNLLNE